MRQITLHIVREHGANLEFWFSASIADMIYGWQQIEFSLVLPAPVFRFLVTPFAEEVPVELPFCVGV